MRSIKTFFALASLGAALVSCSRENNFYIMGRQQIYLDYPADYTIYAPSYAEYPIPFKWHSLRHYADNEILMDRTPAFASPARHPMGVTWQSSSLKSCIVDSMCAVIGYAPLDTATIYWKIQTVNPEDGWCEDVKILYFVRFGQRTSQILLDEPDPNYEFYCTRGESRNLTLKWKCDKYIDDYVLHFSTDKDFASGNWDVEMGDKTSYTVLDKKIDSFLESCGLGVAAKANLYWKVTGSGDAYTEVVESPRRTVKARRFANPAVELTYSAPAAGSEIALEAGGPSVEFSWQADTTVSFTLKLHDVEFGTTWSVNCSDNQTWTMTPEDLDDVLSGTFGMVSGQKQKFQWWVEASPAEAIVSSEEKRDLIIRRI